MRKVRGGKLTPPQSIIFAFSNFNFKPVELKQVEKVVADVFAQIEHRILLDDYHASLWMHAACTFRNSRPVTNPK